MKKVKSIFKKALALMGENEDIIGNSDITDDNAGCVNHDAKTDLWEKCFIGAQLSRHIDLKIPECKKTLVAFISLCNP